MLRKVEVLRWESVIIFYDSLAQHRLDQQADHWLSVVYDGLQCDDVLRLRVYLPSPVRHTPAQSSPVTGTSQLKETNVFTSLSLSLLSLLSLSSLYFITECCEDVVAVWWWPGVGWKCCDKLLTPCWLTDVARCEADSGLKTGQAVERPAVQWVEWRGVECVHCQPHWGCCDYIQPASNTSKEFHRT